MPKLTLGEELELGRRIRTGDGHARNELIEANLHVVEQVLPKYVAKKGVLADDLKQEGHLGLLRASDSYDPKFGVPFATHARSWVKECMRMHVVNCGHAIRVPHQTTRKFSKLEQFKTRFKGEHGRLPTDQEILRGLHWSAEQLATARASTPAVNGTNLEDDRLVAEEAVDDDEIERSQAKMATLNAAMAELTWFHRRFLEMYYGVDHMGTWTIEEIAARLEFRTRRHKHVHAYALDVLRTILARLA